MLTASRLPYKQKRVLHKFSMSKKATEKDTLIKLECIIHVLMRFELCE